SQTARFAFLAALTGGLTALGSGCSSDSDTAGQGGGGGQSEWAEGPLYVASTRVFSPEGSTGYLLRLHDLDGSEEVDLGQAIELEEDAWVFGKADPFFYTASVFSPRITQWSVDDQGELIQGDTVSFELEGVTGTYTAAFVPLYSASKSYFVDGGSGQVVIWNPEKVELIDTITLDVEVPDGVDAPADATPNVELTVAGDRVLVNVFWSSQASGWTESPDISRLIVIDSATDQIVETIEQPGCASISPAGTSSDGLTYYAPWDYQAAVRAVYGEDHGSASCGLRLARNASAFDQEFEVDLSSLVGGKPAGSAYLVDDERLLLHVWESELADATPENWVEESRWASAYRWYEWKIGEAEATLLADQAPSAEGGAWQKLGDQLVSYSPNSEYTETTYLHLTDDGRLISGRVVPGWTAATVRVR
ncbi:MAG TPA: hypothetical protein VLC09_05830, partial [Polyangiaceae bacterium]|nr:hypothetical protein [Polyangiaceae bacterium]